MDNTTKNASDAQEFSSQHPLDGEASSSSDGSGSSTPLPKQPCDSFMLYRKSKLGSPSLLHFSNLSSSQISAEIAELWNNEPDEVKLQYQRQAEQERLAFVQAFPDYKYRRSKSKSARKDQDPEEEISRSKELATVEGRLGMVLEEESRSKE
ncbi:hypothetical protein BGZ70_004055 [Mortierella alpina]|uniref:HMG box domain-containing protein n=1 Tax=Mortierella alpina TaxID=64518 RepID=A0A9P6JEZ2_MORAP|nr:hypothetical protein BGZ70_004055 [Mortierella alpina]